MTIVPQQQVTIAAFVLLAGAAAAHEAPAKEAVSDLIPGQAIEDVATLADPEYTYALYLPSAYEPSAKWPILYVLDPRGRAVMALELFRDAAERNGFIIVSSHQTRSDTGTPVTAQAFQALFNDIPRRFSSDPQRLVVAGMSGTAHAAWGFAQTLEAGLAGVIACAGGVQAGTYGPPEEEVPFAYYGITMTDDFNYREMMLLEGHLDEVGSPHHFEVTAGRHGWPPREATERALDWMTLQFTLAGFAPPYEGFVEDQWMARRTFAHALDDPLSRLRHLRSLERDFAGRGFSEQDAAELERLASSDEVAAARKLERRLARRERSYITNSLAAWQRQVLAAENPPDVPRSKVRLRLASLHEQARDPDPRRAASARRLLEKVYTRASFYLPRSLAGDGRTGRAEIALRVATEIFPDRAWTYWRLANLYLDADRQKHAIEALAQALQIDANESGFLAPESLRRDPRWETARSLPEWSQIEAQIGD